MKLKNWLFTLAALGGFFIFGTVLHDAYGVTRLYDRNSGDIIDADKDNAEWDNTNNAINTHEADTSAHGATGGVVGASKVQTLSNKTFNGNLPIVGSGDLLIYSSSDTSVLKASINGTTGKIVGAPVRIGTYNIDLARATTSATGDSIKIQCGGSSCSSINPGFVVMNGTTAGVLTQFAITSDVTINMTGATWGADTTGDLTGRILRVLAVNDNGTLRWCVALLGGRDTLLTTDTNATASNIDLPEEVLCNTAVGSSTNSVFEVGYFRSDFDDTGGSSENLNTIQSGINDVVIGKSADGLWQPWNPVLTGWSSYSVTAARWSQIGRMIYLQFTVNGTSNSTNSSLTAPTKANSSDYYIGSSITRDNGSELDPFSPISMTAGSATIGIFKSNSSVNFTSSGTKSLRTSPAIIYGVGPTASFID